MTLEPGLNLLKEDYVWRSWLFQNIPIAHGLQSRSMNHWIEALSHKCVTDFDFWLTRDQHVHTCNLGSKGGAVVRALATHQCGPGSNLGFDAICWLILWLVLSLAPRGFSPGTPVFPSPQKTTFPNSNSIRNHVDQESLYGCATSKSLFIYLFIYLFISELLVPLLGVNDATSVSVLSFFPLMNRLGARHSSQ